MFNAAGDMTIFNMTETRQSSVFGAVPRVTFTPSQGLETPSDLSPLEISSSQTQTGYDLLLRLPGQPSKLTLFLVLSPILESDNYLMSLLANKGVIFMIALVVAILW
jgi:hypothetical protein